MMIQYVLTKAEWDDYHEANHIIAKIKAILATSGIYNHELSIPAMTMYLVAKNDELNTAHKTLTAVTEQLKEAHEEIVKLTQGWADCVLKRSKAEEQRDRLAEALNRISEYQGVDDEDPKTMAIEALQSLNQPTP